MALGSRRQASYLGWSGHLVDLSVVVGVHLVWSDGMVHGQGVQAKPNQAQGVGSTCIYRSLLYIMDRVLHARTPEGALSQHRASAGWLPQSVFTATWIVIPERKSKAVLPIPTKVLIKGSLSNTSLSHSLPSFLVHHVQIHPQSPNRCGSPRCYSKILHPRDAVLSARCPVLSTENVSTDHLGSSSNPLSALAWPSSKSDSSPSTSTFQRTC